MAQAWDLPLKSHTAKLVLLAIADNANDQGHCWPSMATLARKCGLTTRAVRAQINAMEKAGVLTAKRGNGRTSTRYHIHIPEGNDIPPAKRGGNDIPPREERHAPSEGNHVPPNHKGTIIEPLVLEGRASPALDFSQDPAKEKPRRQRSNALPDPIFDMLDPEAFTAPMTRWFHYRRELGKPFRSMGWEEALKVARKIPLDQLESAVSHSIAGSYQQIYQPGKSNGIKHERTDTLNAPDRYK
jgi:hypothetical protein